MIAEPTNGLTPAEAERLAMLMEECSEVIKECAKILRFGYAPMVGYKNRETLTIELGDLMAIAHMLVEAGDIKEDDAVLAMEAKLEKVKHYTKHQ